METCRGKGFLRRGITFLMVLAMMLSFLPAIARAEEAPADPNVHVLEASKLTAFAAGDKADGDSETVGEYFTILYSAKSKVDSSSKEWEDGYTSGQRINFGGKAETTKNAVKFTTSGSATVKIWWAKNGDDGRQMTILDAAGSSVAATTGEHTKNSAYYDALEIAEAGTYYLGGDTNGNYIFKVEVEEAASAAKEFTLEANSFGGEVDKAGAPEEKAGTDDYFTINWGNKGKVSTTKEVFPDGYAPGFAINFDGKSSKDSRFIRFTASQAGSVKIWWYNGGSNRNIHLTNGEGTEIAVTTEGGEDKTANISTLEFPAADTYTLETPDGTCHFMKVVVTEGTVEKPERADWADVVDPEIVEVALNEDPHSIDVTVTGRVGYDYADRITVVMMDEDGWELGSKNSAAEKDEHVLTFTPSASGTYLFKVEAARDKEDEIHTGAKTESFDFILPLEAPVPKYAGNCGKGKITVEWNPVQEATGYTVTANSQIKSTTDTRADFDGFEIGEEVSVTVAAVRGEENGEACEPMTVTVAEEAEIAWVFSTFGQSTSTKNDGYEVLDNGDVRVYSLNGAGKVQPGDQDGLAFYYTAIDPTTTNFRLSATAHVNEWTYSNGQEGFGFFVMDRVGVNGKTDPIYCNSYMLGASKMSGTSANMNLGVGVLERSGVTEVSDTRPSTFTATWTAIDFSQVGKGITNMVGGCTNKLANTYEPELLDFDLTIEKTDEGYTLTYINVDGEECSHTFTQPNFVVDPYIYVGMFAARNMDVTYTNIEFTTSAASGSGSGTTDPGTGETEVVAHDYSFTDPTSTNTSEYTLDFNTNADGRLVVRDAANKTIFRQTVKAGVRTEVPVTLTEGENTFTAVMTPDEGFAPAANAVLDTYDSVYVTHTVTLLKTDERDVIYVSPDGEADAAGTKEAPTTLAAAVKCPAPGTAIYLMEGTYDLSGGLTIQRGINGTKEEPILLAADPEAETRPVLDSANEGKGLVLSGDYWHLKGFDSTRSTAKGVHVGGSFNVVEDVNVYRNGNTGLSVTRTFSTGFDADWPSYNLILNCSAWLNADLPGYEDADGFEAKLTTGDGNVFDGCIAAYNADDGWDLYARGAYIGEVTLKNCVAFKNGYDIVDGKQVNAGNGNGFKLGGNNYEIDHKIINSVAFANKASGITCNSNPNLKIEDCTVFANEGSNLSLYTTIGSLDTDFGVDGLISYKGGKDDSIKAQGNQDKSKYLGENNYYVGNSSGAAVTDEWFENLDTDAAINGFVRNVMGIDFAGTSEGITRREDGSIEMNGYLVKTDKAPEDSGAAIPETSSEAVAPEAPAPEVPDEPEKPSIPAIPGGSSKPSEPPKPAHKFADVADDSVYADAVNELYEKGYINGVTANEFMPEKGLTRAEFATIFYRMSGMETPNLILNYTDVKEGDWFADAVRFVTNVAVAGGYGDGRFGPNDELTLEQLACMIYRYAEFKQGGSLGTTALSLDAADAAAVSDWAYEAVCWCVINGIFVPENGILAPQSVVSRGEAAMAIAAYLATK